MTNNKVLPPLFITSFFLLLLPFLGMSQNAPPMYVYLTWQGSTSTTMTINFQTKDSSASEVWYDVVSRVGEVDSYTKHASGTAHQIDSLEDGRWIHWVELTGLKPGGTYYFVAGDVTVGVSQEKKFRTIPNNRKPLHFVVGGDMGFDPVVDTLMQFTAAQEPQFVMIGGDIAYADGKLENVNIWDLWLNRYQEHMVTPKGYLIPLVLAIGNHEVRGYFDGTPELAPFYFGFFAQSGDQSWYTRTFGSYFKLFVMDTYQATSLDGPELAWIDSTMSATEEQYTSRFALYHVPMYPAIEDTSNPLVQFLWDNWLPIFDKNDLDVAFENHEHCFKRTKQLRANQVVEDGTLYLGNGAYGRGPAMGVDTSRYYLEKASSTLQFWICDVSPNKYKFQSMNKYGDIFDSVTIREKKRCKWFSWLKKN